MLGGFFHGSRRYPISRCLSRKTRWTRWKPLSRVPTGVLGLGLDLGGQGPHRPHCSYPWVREMMGDHTRKRDTLGGVLASYDVASRAAALPRSPQNKVLPDPPQHNSKTRGSAGLGRTPALCWGVSWFDGEKADPVHTTEFASPRLSGRRCQEEPDRAPPEEVGKCHVGRLGEDLD